MLYAKFGDKSNSHIENHGGGYLEVIQFLINVFNGDLEVAK